MKRMLSIALTAALVTGLAATQAWAGPGCCKKDKTAKAASCSASKSACEKLGEFPTMISMVGEEKFQCPVSAEKAAAQCGAKVVFIVNEEKFDCRQTATIALAEASEAYVSQFTSIACVKDGKVIYCDGESGSSCSKARTASAEVPSCGKSKAQLISEEPVCSKSKSKLASAEGSGCCKSKAKTASAEGSGCCKSKAKTASAKGDGCSKSKAKLASDEKSGCSKLKTASLAKASCGESCKGAKFLVLGRTFEKYEDAVKVRDAARAELKSVRMTYIVDGTKVDCSSKVCPVAKKEGKVKFVVGDTQTGCEMTARASLARAQYEAAQKIAHDQLAKI